jgi:DNA-binding response OmpR family regulator
VLLDHQLPDTTGLEVLEAIRARPHPPAIILITAHGNESLAATALRRGADDYLAKDLSLGHLLPQVLERVRRTRELRKALVAAERDLVRAERLAAIGEMTVTLHHEINNPLMAAFAHVELLLADPAMGEAARLETLGSVKEALRRIGDIVRRIGDLREVRTKSYATGVQMVDLDDRGPASSVQRGRALLLVTDEDLARIVSLLLRHAGFEVERVADGTELGRRAAGGQARLVVAFGGTDAAGAHPLGGFFPPPGRGYRVVALVSGDGAGAIAAGADHVVELPFDPGAFATEVIELTGGA